MDIYLENNAYIRIWRFKDKVYIRTQRDDVTLSIEQAKLLSKLLSDITKDTVVVKEVTA